MNKPIGNELSDTELDVVSGGACRGGDDDSYQRDQDRDRDRNRGGRMHHHHHHHNNNGNGGNDHDHDRDDMHRPY